MDALGALGLLVLGLHAAAYVAVVVAVARARPARALPALVLPPLAVLWGWEAGAKKAVVAYGVTLTAFAVIVLGLVVVR